MNDNPWKPPITRRDILDQKGMQNYRLPTSRSNVGDVIEGQRVNSLVSVFRQLEENNIGRRSQG